MGRRFRMDFQILSVAPNQRVGGKNANEMTKSQLIEKINEQHSALSKKDVKGVLETLATIGYKELKKNGVFLVPGFAKFVVIKKPATNCFDPSRHVGCWYIASFCSGGAVPSVRLKHARPDGPARPEPDPCPVLLA
jgi:nucleoid DNA-binding protein